LNKIPVTDGITLYRLATFRYDCRKRHTYAVLWIWNILELECSIRSNHVSLCIEVKF